jgi:hypothetical protein
MITRYQIKPETGDQFTFDVQNHKDLDPRELNNHSDLPDWVKLEYHQCPICPFKSENVTFCPAAFELQDVVLQCSSCISYERVELSRIAEGGTVTTETDMQRALFAVIGEKVISSACSVLNSRQWSLDYYSILTTAENLFYRSISSYLVRQFFISPGNRDPDLKGHLDYLDEVINIFSILLQRIRGVSSQDANNNALGSIVMSGQLLRHQRDDWLDALKDKMGL